MLYCTPFLLFDGNCAEAMTFCKECLGGDLTLTKTGDTPMKEQFPPEKYDKIINAHLKSGRIEFSATDWHADNLEPKPGNTFSICVSGGTFSDLKGMFDKLAHRIPIAVSLLRRDFSATRRAAACNYKEATAPALKGQNYFVLYS